MSSQPSTTRPGSLTPRRPPRRSEILFTRVRPTEREAVVAAAEKNAYTLSEQLRVWVRQGLAEADNESA